MSWISRQTYYYQPKKEKNEAELEEAVEEIFYQNRKLYGARKIKKVFIPSRNAGQPTKNQSDYEKTRIEIHLYDCLL